MYNTIVVTSVMDKTIQLDPRGLTPDHSNVKWIAVIITGIGIPNKRLTKTFGLDLIASEGVVQSELGFFISNNGVSRL